MYSEARVIKINDDGTVLVGCSTQACQGCKAQMFCNNKNDNSYLSLNSKKLELKEGSDVELFLPPGKTVLSSVLVFALPLVFFPVGYYIIKAFTSLNEVLCALGGFASMALAFLITAVVSIKKKKALMPVIVRTLD